MKKYYVDTCIYLNLWKKEGDSRFGKPYWRIAEEFFEKLKKENCTIYYSGFILKELMFKLSPRIFRKKMMIFDFNKNFIKINASSADFEAARKIENKTDYKISFYDIIYMVLSRKHHSILITRDKNLLDVCAKYSVLAKKPEDLL
jgi:predicted nucleic acid-binding protein